MAVLWFAVTAALLVRAAMQRGLLPAPQSAGEDDRLHFVSIIVPARNEEANIDRCMASLLAQDYPCDMMEVIVVDDASTDRTAELVAMQAQADPRLRLLSADALPQGWTGKSHACWAGAEACDPRSTLLCFIDADVCARPHLISRAVSMMENDRSRLVSLVPAHRLLSFAERLLLPCGFYILAFLGDLSRLDVQDDVRATGQFLLTDAKFYHAMGGHRAIRSAICEDLELARQVHRTGGRVIFADGHDLLNVRLYDGWRSLWIGLSKNLVETLGGDRCALMTAFVAPLLAWATILLPCVCFIHASTRDPASLVAAATATLASLAIFSFHIAGATHFRIPLWYALLFPIGYSIGALIALDALRRRRAGRIVWKGRIYS